MKGSSMSGTSIFDSVAGTAAPTAVGSAHGMSTSQLSALANQQFNSAYNQIMGQQNAMLAQQYNQALMAQNQHQWMINGRTMTFDDFLDEICPDQDDPHRTWLTLKYQGIK